MEKLNSNEILQIVKKDLDNAKEAKTSIEKKIVEWRKLYEAENEQKIQGRSQFISKDAKKTIHWYIPNAMKPFLSTEDMTEAIPQSADDVDRATSQSALLNYQFSNDFDKFGFVRESLFIMASEGTVVSRTGWEHEEEEVEEEFSNVNAQELQVLMNNAEVLEVQEEYNELGPVYSGKLKTNRVMTSRPTADIIKNEDFFIDPTASSIDKADYVVQRIETNMSSLRKQDKKYNENGIYENVDDLSNSLDDADSNLQSDRNTNLNNRGQNNDSVTEDDARQKAVIYEYYGNIDMDGNGITQPIVCVFSGNTILRLGKNPFPDNLPPFISTPFSAKPFSFWGDALPEFIGDVQNVKTAIMRTFIDLMANSTNGMKHVRKGSIDAFNIKKLREAKIGSVVEWNDLSGYEPEAKNDIPSSLMSMYELFTAEGENESGITRYNQGTDASSLNKTATGVTAILNQSQMRIWETSAQFAENYLKPLMRKWIAYNQKWLSEEKAIRIAGNEYVSVTPDDIGGKLDLKLNVAISGTSEQKAQHIMQLFQTSLPLVQAGVVSPTHLGKLFSKLEELWGFKELASELMQLVEHQELQQAQQMQQPQQMQPQNQPQGVM